MTSKELNGIGILVTRPAHQAEPLCNLIEQRGGKTFRFPALQIETVENSDGLSNILNDIDNADMVIFVSVNAVEEGIKKLQQFGKGISEQVDIACIGATSATALGNLGITPNIVPQHRFNSEALLALPELQQLRNKNVIIFRGLGGRPTIGEALSKRGAKVHYAECYKRSKPDIDPADIINAWQQKQIDIAVVSSTEGLLNLYDMVGDKGRKYLLATPLITPSQRVADKVKSMGFQLPARVAANAGDTAVLEAILLWHQQQKAL